MKDLSPTQTIGHLKQLLKDKSLDASKKKAIKQAITSVEIVSKLAPSISDYLSKQVKKK